MVKLNTYVPSDFARRPRSLKDLKHFKATEFRQFVLYIGPVVLSGMLDSDKYSHFLLLHSAIHILSTHLCEIKEWVDYAGYLLNKFVEKAEILYFKEILVQHAFAKAFTS